MVDIDRVESAEAGKEFTFSEVLFLEKDGGEMLAGAPFVANAKVVGIVDGESRGPKIRVFKKKRRKGFRKTRGHRSIFTRVRITDIRERSQVAGNLQEGVDRRAVTGAQVSLSFSRFASGEGASTASNAEVRAH